MRYVRPKSLTWWAGLFSVITGVAMMALPESENLNEVGVLLALLAGGGSSSPASLIALGLGLIGIREKLERGFKNGDH